VSDLSDVSYPSNVSDPSDMSYQNDASDVMGVIQVM